MTKPQPELIMNFRSYHKTGHANDAIPTVATMPEEKKRPIITLSRAPSVKIKTPAITVMPKSHPVLSQVPPPPPPPPPQSRPKPNVDNSADMYNIHNETGVPPRPAPSAAPSTSSPPVASDSIVAQAMPVIPTTTDKKANLSAGGTSKKRKSEGEAPAPKRPKTDKNPTGGGSAKKSGKTLVVKRKIKDGTNLVKMRELTMDWPAVGKAGPTIKIKFKRMPTDVGTGPTSSAPPASGS
jgi:hypothetical protein